MDGEDVCKLFASDFGTVKVFAGERMINMFLSSDGVVYVFCVFLMRDGPGVCVVGFSLSTRNLESRKHEKFRHCS